MKRVQWSLHQKYEAMYAIWRPYLLPRPDDAAVDFNVYERQFTVDADAETFAESLRRQGVKSRIK